MSILTLGSKQEKKENFQSKRKQKKKRKEIPNQRVGESKKKSKEIPNQRMGERKKKRKKIPNQRMGESKKRRKLLVKETRRNVQKGLLTRQYLNNTELSPNEQKKEKETMT